MVIKKNKKDNLYLSVISCFFLEGGSLYHVIFYFSGKGPRAGGSDPAPKTLDVDGSSSHPYFPMVKLGLTSQIIAG